VDARRVHAHEDQDEKEIAEIVGTGIARVPARTPVAVGDRVRLQLTGEGLHFFDPATGRAIRSEKER
jgi:hypothetical protein